MDKGEKIAKWLDPVLSKILSKQLPWGIITDAVMFELCKVSIQANF